MEGKYIFGIIEALEEKIFNSCGMSCYEEVYTIPFRDISAVVSDSQFINYTILPKDEVARYLLTHQQVIEKIMDVYTIIPMRLGTYAFNIREVEEILLRGYALFKDIFRKIDNKIEMDVVATWNDLNSTIKEISEANEIRSLKEKLMSGPEGVSVEDQIKIGSLIRNILDKKRERCSFEVEAALSNATVESENPKGSGGQGINLNPRTPESSNPFIRRHDLMDDRMIFNSAFLIDKDRKAEFEKELDGLDELYAGKINFRCVGPLPPYSFYTAEVKKIPFNDIEWAKEKLSLNDMATRDEIVKAYRGKANLYHPDKNLGSPDAERQFNKIFKAYKILLEYCLSAEQADQGDACSFNEKWISQDAIIVKARE